MLLGEGSLPAPGFPAARLLFFFLFATGLAPSAEDDDDDDEDGVEDDEAEDPAGEVARPPDRLTAAQAPPRDSLSATRGRARGAWGGREPAPAFPGWS